MCLQENNVQWIKAPVWKTQLSVCLPQSAWRGLTCQLKLANVPVVDWSPPPQLWQIVSLHAVKQTGRVYIVSERRECKRKQGRCSVKATRQVRRDAICQLIDVWLVSSDLRCLKHKKVHFFSNSAEDFFLKKSLHLTKMWAQQFKIWCQKHRISDPIV